MASPYFPQVIKLLWKSSFTLACFEGCANIAFPSHQYKSTSGPAARDKSDEWKITNINLMQNFPRFSISGKPFSQALSHFFTPGVGKREWGLGERGFHCSVYYASPSHRLLASHSSLWQSVQCAGEIPTTPVFFGVASKYVIITLDHCHSRSLLVTTTVKIGSTPAITRRTI